ncbi:unnamed protein product, partial [Polarella glacialis]
GSDWTMDFWKRSQSNDWWRFRARSPAFEHDKKAADCADVEGSASEYVDYARVLQKMDPDCKQDSAVAFPRLSFDSWCPFASGGQELFKSHWRSLTPPGVKDLSARWMKQFAAVFHLDFLEFFARFFKVSLGAAGSISRLHVANHGAHSWYTQIEGKRLFFLCSPREGANLCE